MKRNQRDDYCANLQVHAGSFCVSVIHRTLAWTTGSCVIMVVKKTQGLGTPTVSQHNSFQFDYGLEAQDWMLAWEHQGDQLH